MSYTYKAKVEGKEISLKLTDKEVEGAMSILNNGYDEVHIMKKNNGGALFFADERRAIGCQQRHKFDYMFSLKKADIEDYFNKLSEGKKKPESK